MIIRDTIYVTRDDDEDLTETLHIMKNVHNIFENCAFERVSTKTFNDCQFINCSFEDVGSSVFSNCQFDMPKFYEGFRGSFYNCSISTYTGKIGEPKT